MVPGSCSQSTGTEYSDWTFACILPAFSRAGLWRATVQAAPLDLEGNMVFEVGFDYSIVASGSISFQAIPGSIQTGSPSPLGLDIVCNDDAHLFISSDGLSGGAGDIPSSSMIFDDDPVLYQDSEVKCDPIAVALNPSQNLPIAGGPERTINLYPFILCPSGKPDDDSFTGKLNLHLDQASDPADSSNPTVSNLRARTPGYNDLIGPADSIEVVADITDDYYISSVIFSLGIDSGPMVYKQISWTVNGFYQVNFDEDISPGQVVNVGVEVIDVAGHVSTDQTTQSVGEEEGITGVWVGDLQIWEDDNFSDLYDIFPSFPFDGWASVYAEVSSASWVKLHYERMYAGLPHIFDSGTISMSRVASAGWNGFWEARIRVAPSERVNYWVETSDGILSSKKSFTALPDVWNDHYGYGLLSSWGEDDWSPETMLENLDQVYGSFVIPINTWGQSSTNPPRYFYPFSDREGLWEPEFGGNMQMTGWYEEWKQAWSDRDPSGSFYSTSWFFYHRTWRDDSPPVPGPHTADQLDRVTRKLGRLIATDPTWRALVLDQEYANYHNVKDMLTLGDDWDDNSDGTLSSTEFEYHMVTDILDVLRDYRSDTWYGGQPHLGYRWSGHNIPSWARLAGSINHFQHADADGSTDWYFTDHFDSSIDKPLLSAGVSACASDLATDYHLHQTMDRHQTATDWSLGYAEQLLYAYLLNPHYVTNWVHSGWNGPSAPGSQYSFDSAEKAFTRGIVSKWNHVPYLSDMIYSELPTGGSRPFGRRQLGSRPGWFQPVSSNLYFSLCKESGSMWQLAVSNFESSSQSLTFDLGSGIFDSYGSDSLAVFDAADPASPWTYVTRSNNRVTVGCGAYDMKVLKIGIPVEILGLPQGEDGYSSQILGAVQEPDFKGYDRNANEVSLHISTGTPQFIKLYLPSGETNGRLAVNGIELECALQTPDTRSISKTDEITALVGYIEASSQPPPEVEGPSPDEYILDQIKSHGGFGPHGISVELDSTYWWNSFGTMAGNLAGATLPTGLASDLRNSCPSSGNDVRKMDLIVSALDSINEEQISGIAQVLKSAQNLDVDGRNYNNGIEWEYRRVHALHLLGDSPPDQGSIIGRVLNSQDPTTGGWERDPIGQNLASLEGFDGEEPCVWRTHHAVMILNYLGADIPSRSKVVSFLRDQQNSNGGWGYVKGRPSDIYPTWCAIQALDALGEDIPNSAGVISFISSLFNPDGGFGDRPGWYSRLESTFYALDALEIVDTSIPTSTQNTNSEPYWFSDPGYGIYSATFEFYNGNYGYDSPGEAAIYASKMGLDVVAPKTGGSEIAQRFNLFAEEYNLGSMSVVSAENYGFKLHFNGHHWCDHSGEEAYPAGGSEADFPYSSGSTMGTSFETFVSSNSGFLSNGITWWNSINWKTYHMTKDILDGAIDLGGGYNGLWCQGIDGKSIPEQNPWIEKYMGRISPVTECDNHGWAHRGARLVENGKTIFIAKNPTWSGLKDAIDNTRTAYVTSDGQIWGDPWVVDYLKSHSSQWSLPSSPLVIVLPITEENSWEWGGRGISWESWGGGGAVVRILAQDGTTPGEGEAQTSIQECRIDGSTQSLEFVSAEEIGNDISVEAKYVHSYYYVERFDLSPGQHTVEVDYTDGGQTRTETVTFSVP